MEPQEDVVEHLKEDPPMDLLPQPSDYCIQISIDQGHSYNGQLGW